MYEALKDAEDAGYLVANINAKSENELVWDETLDRFALLDKDNNLISGEVADANNKVKLWKISKVIDAEYSTYYIGEDKVIETSKGFDAGDTEGITSIEYTNDSNVAQTVVIRTNSAGTTLTVNAPLDTIHHYDALGALNIVESATSSYHENGKVAYAEIAKGRIVLEAGSKVEEIHVNKKENEQAFDTVIIANNGGEAALPQRITRDAVSVAEETLVVRVESNGSSENVYVYADGATGKTNKVTEGANKQNENVNSALGQLVLDNGANPGEKAQTAQEKQEAKDEVVEEAKSEEIMNKGEKEGKNYVARIGMDAYESLQAAWNVGANKTITLLADLTQNAYIVTTRYTIDLNGHTLTLRGHSQANSAGIFVHGDASLNRNGNFTVKNGTLNFTGANASSYGIYCYGTLSMENVTIASECNEAIHIEGHSYGNNNTISFNKVTVNATKNALQVNGYKGYWGSPVVPTINISNSNITSGTGSSYNALSLNGAVGVVTDSTFTSANNKAIFVYSNGTASGLVPELTVSGEVTANASSAYNQFATSGTVTISITSGIYNFNPTNYVDTELFDVTENDGVWTVAAK